MLIQFSLENFKCFKEEVKFSLVASNYDKNTRVEDNLFSVEKFGLKLLRSAVVYGANASGKSKLFEGLEFMRQFVLNSSKEGQINEPTGVIPFLLSTETIEEPSAFEVIFIHHETMYRYGFEVNSKKVCAEWLYRKKRTKEVELFYRDFQDFELHKTEFKVTDLVKNDRIRSNALLLSVAANWNDELAKSLLEWFTNCNSISGLREEEYEGYSIKRMRENQVKKRAVIQFLKRADLGIDNLSERKFNINDLPQEFPEVLKEFFQNATQSVEVLSDISTSHKLFDSKKSFIKHVPFSMNEHESSGTKQYFALSGPVLETLENGKILFVDELANKLHPNLTKKLVAIFNSKASNPNNAQLIFNTHDTNLLSADLFRRDQIWFLEKNRYGASSLYSLSDFKGIRKDADFEKNYIEGKYGAVPYLADFEKMFTHQTPTS